MGPFILSLHRALLIMWPMQPHALGLLGWGEANIPEVSGMMQRVAGVSSCYVSGPTEGPPGPFCIIQSLTSLAPPSHHLSRLIDIPQIPTTSLFRELKNSAITDGLTLVTPSPMKGNKHNNGRWWVKSKALTPKSGFHDRLLGSMHLGRAHVWEQGK